MGRTRLIVRQIRWYGSSLRWFTASLMGDNHYGRYLEHRARTHPGEPVCTEAEYWRMRHAASEADPQSRCC